MDHLKKYERFVLSEFIGKKFTDEQQVKLVNDFTDTFIDFSDVGFELFYANGGTLGYIEDFDGLEDLNCISFELHSENRSNSKDVVKMLRFTKLNLEKFCKRLEKIGKCVVGEKKVWYHHGDGYELVNCKNDIYGKPIIDVDESRPFSSVGLLVTVYPKLF